ncbi:hypothetical protein SCA6_008083, partial [Theobroma cacao]
MGSLPGGAADQGGQSKEEKVDKLVKERKEKTMQDSQRVKKIARRGNFSREQVLLWIGGKLLYLLQMRRQKGQSTRIFLFRNGVSSLSLAKQRD